MAIDEGVRLTDERVKQLMQRLESVYTDAYKTAVKNNEKAIAKYASLTDEALKDLAPEARQLKRDAFAREIRRTEGLKNKIAAEIANAGKTAAEIIRGEMTGIYGLNYGFAAYDIQQQAELGLSFTQYDRNQLAVVVQKGQSPFIKIAYKKLGGDAKIVRRLQDQFIQGVTNGESQQKLIQRIKAVTGQSTRQAKRVAQTERNRVQSQARNQAIHEAVEMGLGMQKQWIARLHNTRESHMKLHLQIINDGEMFDSPLGKIEFPGDPNGTAENVINCFCVLKPIVKTSSKASVASREKWAKKSFEQAIEKTGSDIIIAQTDIDYYKERVAANRELLNKAEKRGDTKAMEYHMANVKKSQSKLAYSRKHLTQAQENHAYAVEKWRGDK